MRIVIVALVAVMALSFVSLAEGEKAVPAGTTVTTVKTDMVRVGGQLTKIDGKSLTLAVKSGDGTKDVVVTIADVTKVSTREDTKGAKPVDAKVEDLKVGQSVRVNYDKTTNVAASIIIMVKPAAAAAPAPAADAK